MEVGVFVTKPPVVEKKRPREKPPDHRVGKTSFGAVSSFEIGVAGGLFEMLRSGFHPFSGLRGNVWAFPHSEGAEWTRAADPLVALAGRHFTGNTSAALFDAECPAGFQWAMGCSIGRPDTHSVGPERAVFMLTGLDDFEVAFLRFPIHAEDTVFPNSFEGGCHSVFLQPLAFWMMKRARKKKTRPTSHVLEGRVQKGAWVGVS